MFCLTYYMSGKELLLYFQLKDLMPHRSGDVIIQLYDIHTSISQGSQ